MFYAQFRHICTLHGPVYAVRPMQRKIDLKNVVYFLKKMTQIFCVCDFCALRILFLCMIRDIFSKFMILDTMHFTIFATVSTDKLRYKSQQPVIFSKLFAVCNSNFCAMLTHQYHLKKYILTSILFLFSGRGGSAGAKFRIALGLPVGAVINCADNTGKKKVLKKYFMKQ